MVEATGLEPAASWSQTKHSTKLSYASSNSFIIIQRFDSFVNSFFENCKIRYQKNQFGRIYYANSTKLKPTQKGRLKASYSINKFYAASGLFILYEETYESVASISLSSDLKSRVMHHIAEIATII